MEEVIIALIRGFIANLYLLDCHSRTATTTKNVEYGSEYNFFFGVELISEHS